MSPKCNTDGFACCVRHADPVICVMRRLVGFSRCVRRAVLVLFQLYNLVRFSSFVQLVVLVMRVMCMLDASVYVGEKPISVA